MERERGGNTECKQKIVDRYTGERELFIYQVHTTVRHSKNRPNMA
jgi:hypothetical protein